MTETELVNKIVEYSGSKSMFRICKTTAAEILREYFEEPDTQDRRKKLFDSLATWAQISNLELVYLSNLLDNYDDPRNVLQLT